VTARSIASGSDLALLQSVMDRRHSCRSFLQTPVPRPTIEQILAATARTASWCNAQPWLVHIVSGAPLEALRNDLVAQADAGVPPEPELDWPVTYRGLFQERRRACGRALYEAVGVRHGDREASGLQTRENFRLFGAPHVAIMTSEAALGTHGVMDCGAWVAHFMLAAAAGGLGSVAQAALASWPDVLRKHLEIGSDKQIVCGISFGYEDTAHPANGFRTTRAPASETVAFVG
jgi:nitroreductase